VPFRNAYFVARNATSAREMGSAQALQVRIGVSGPRHFSWVRRTGGRPAKTQRSPHASIDSGTG